MKNLNIFKLNKPVLTACITAVLALSVNAACAQAADSTGPGRLTGTSARAETFVAQNAPTTTVAQGTMCGLATLKRVCVDSRNCNNFTTSVVVEATCQGYNFVNKVSYYPGLAYNCPSGYTGKAAIINSSSNNGYTAMEGTASCIKN